MVWRWKHGKILGCDNIILGNYIIKNVALVDGLKHTLLSISQITNRGYHVDSWRHIMKQSSKRPTGRFT